MRASLSPRLRGFSLALGLGLLSTVTGATAAVSALPVPAPLSVDAAVQSALSMLGSTPTHQTPQALRFELRRVGNLDRIFITLPNGTVPFTPQVTVEEANGTREAGLELPFQAAPAQGRLGGAAYRAEGRRLSLMLGPGLEGVRVQFWPAVGNWPPGLALDLIPAATPASAVQAAPAPAAAPVVPAPAPAKPIPSRAGPVQARIVLDPGHGGNDPGMTSRWLREADVNLDVALRTARELEAHGVAVTLTRRSDTHLHPDKGTDLNLRSRMATTGQVSAFISVHVNASTSPAAQGIETYYFGQPLPGQGRSLAVRENGGGSVGETLTAQASASAQGVLGNLLSQAKLSFSRRLAGLVQAELVSASAAMNRGVKTDTFYVIRSPTTPAILTELGFGSNPTEGQRLASPTYRQRQAEAIARAVVRFLNAQ